MGEWGRGGGWGDEKEEEGELELVEEFMVSSSLVGSCRMRLKWWLQCPIQYQKYHSHKNTKTYYYYCYYYC